jgi:DNA-binding PadR family transcriptional regulator
VGDRADGERVDRGPLREAVGSGRSGTLPVKHAVLGLIVERRGYGYELAQRLSERLGPRLAVPEGTVHSAIKSLKGAGHINVVKRSLRGDQVAVWYGATDGGLEEYEAWLDEPVAREPVRGELFLKFAMIDATRVPRLREQFERLELECLAAIGAHTRARPLGDELTDPVSLQTAARLLLDSGALDRLNADLMFVKRTLGVLRWAEAQGSVPRARLLEAVS